MGGGLNDFIPRKNGGTGHESLLLHIAVIFLSSVFQ